jgi:hypothetical protein
MAASDPSTADILTDADRTAIGLVIELQLSAFRRDDALLAFALAAPSAQAAAGTPSRFLHRVAVDLPAVYRPRAVRLGDLTAGDSGPVQEVGLTGPDGRPVRVRFRMERQPDGAWRVAGVTLV